MTDAEARAELRAYVGALRDGERLMLTLVLGEGEHAYRGPYPAELQLWAQAARERLERDEDADIHREPPIIPPPDILEEEEDQAPENRGLLSYSGDDVATLQAEAEAQTQAAQAHTARLLREARERGERS
jgi:hypothetical protein